MAAHMLKRWCSYVSHGKPILDTRIIAFKVPLKKEKMQNTEREHWFTVEDLMKAVPNLGLVIDLCNTNKYYNSRDLEALGVQHKKLVCIGGSVPTKSTVDRFCSIINDYLRSNKDTDKLIGVHCTHGINRTGYLVCRYLMIKWNMQPEEAIKTFEDARGQHIERPEYVEYLKKFSDPKFTDSNVRSNKFVSNSGIPHGRADWNQPRDFSRRSNYNFSSYRNDNGPRHSAHNASLYSRNTRDEMDQRPGSFSNSNRRMFNRSYPGRFHKMDQGPMYNSPLSREKRSRKMPDSRRVQSSRSDGWRSQFKNRHSDEGYNRPVHKRWS